LGTAAGTLILATATFASVRSANKVARVAERSFEFGLRPILAPSRLQDPKQRIMFVDRHWMSVDGGHAGVELADGVVYLAMPVRNVGNGIAVIESWLPFAGQLTVGDVGIEVEHFRPQTRSLWIPPGDVGFWQAALRDETEEIFGVISEAIGEGAVTVELLYRDHEGGQRTVTRFSFIRDDGDARWWVSMSRHQTLDDARTR
jgi:hypothetical protein